MREIEIRDDTIRLGQLLKLANLVGSGADVKGLLTGGVVRVNGVTETRLGRGLRPGDIVAVRGENVRVATRGTTPA